MSDSNRKETFSYLITELNKRNIAFLFAREFQGPDSIGPHLRKLFNGIYIANEKFSQESAEAVIKRGDADAVAFGVPFIANPDLPERVAKNAPLNEADRNTFYSSGPEGYIDYPFLN